MTQQEILLKQIQLLTERRTELMGQLFDLVKPTEDEIESVWDMLCDDTTDAIEQLLDGGQVALYVLDDRAIQGEEERLVDVSDAPISQLRKEESCVKDTLAPEDEPNGRYKP